MFFGGNPFTIIDGIKKILFNSIIRYLPLALLGKSLLCKCNWKSTDP